MARAATGRRGLWTVPLPTRVSAACWSVTVEIIGEGWHEKAGEPHAEVALIARWPRRADNARGATAYVTLEPCSHFGRTPPCADALIAAGVSRVVAAMQDPNPLVAGQGLAKLPPPASSTVESGLLAARRANSTSVSSRA
jgi:diaminohydroxyphosphoribosylaminopyrimidine deaminase/5-amino-6-(5-phosphoribosylamino)uracil reductase